jgi:phage terminase large subunit GpA-like protein
VTGLPVHDGVDASYSLSSHYALSLGWGDIAAEFVGCKDSPPLLRNFVNQWLAETWAPHDRKTTWEQLGKRIIVRDRPRFLVPEYASLVTVGIDRQKDHWAWVMDAWGPERRHATIAYGDAEELQWIAENVILADHSHADGGDRVKPTWTLIDSGFRTEGVYEACRDFLAAGVQVLPCKGASKPLESDFQVRQLGKNTAMPGMALVWVDTFRTQEWIDNVLHVLRPGDPGSAELHDAELQDHRDFLEQLLNDAPLYTLDARNNEREVWERVNASVPNDFRDCRRYSYVAMLLSTRGGPIRARSAKVVKRSAVILPGQAAAMPRGESWQSRNRVRGLGGRRPRDSLG